MAEKKELKLDPSNGSFKLRGKVRGMTSDYALKQGQTKNGDAYKVLQFFVETSPNNRVKVELFGMEMDKVRLQHSEKDPKKRKKQVERDWEDRFDKPKGYVYPFFMSTNLSVRQGSDNKMKKEALLSYDAIEVLYDELEDGDSVYVSGNIQMNEFTTNGGETVTQEKMAVQYVGKQTKEIDFDHEEFSEMADFKTTIIFRGAEKHPDGSKKVLVHGNVIEYGDKVYDIQFIVDAEKEPGLAKNLLKGTKLKEMDSFQVEGLIRSGVEQVEEEEEDDGWGSKTESSKTSGAIVKYLQMTRLEISTHEPKKYTMEELFYNDNAITEEDEDDDGAEFEDEDVDDEDVDDMFG